MRFKSGRFLWEWSWYETALIALGLSLAVVRFVRYLSSFVGWDFF